MRLSRITIAYGAFIIISASFMQQIWEFLEKAAGGQAVKTCAILLFLAVAILALWPKVKISDGLPKIIKRVAIVFLAFLFALWQPIVVEKMHVLEYGLLGWLAMRNLRKNNYARKSIILALVFVCLVSILDESFQKILPYRVGQLRDALTNAIGGAFGILIFLT